MAASEISRYLPRERVVTDLHATERDEFLRLAVERLVELGIVAERSLKTVYKGLLEREMVGSTGIGSGIAIPHLKTKVVDESVVAFFKPVEPVPYGATDGLPVHSLFMVISPIKEADQHVAILRGIAQIARSHLYANILRNTQDGDSIYELFREIDHAT